MPHHLRAAAHRAFRLRPGVAVPRAASRAALHRDSRALGPFAGHQGEHASRQRADVHGRIHHSLERPARAVSAGEIDLLCSIKYLTASTGSAILSLWPPSPHSALPNASPSPSTLGPRTTCAISARPWSAPRSLPPSRVGAASPWASPPLPLLSPPLASLLRARGSRSGSSRPSSPWPSPQLLPPRRPIAPTQLCFPAPAASFF